MPTQTAKTPVRTFWSKYMQNWWLIIDHTTKFCFLVLMKNKMEKNQQIATPQSELHLCKCQEHPHWTREDMVWICHLWNKQQHWIKHHNLRWRSLIETVHWVSLGTAAWSLFLFTFSGLWPTFSIFSWGLSCSRSWSWSKKGKYRKNSSSAEYNVSLKIEPHQAPILPGTALAERICMWPCWYQEGFCKPHQTWSKQWQCQRSSVCQADHCTEAHSHSAKELWIVKRSGKFSAFDNILLCGKKHLKEMKNQKLHIISHWKISCTTSQYLILFLLFVDFLL